MAESRIRRQRGRLEPYMSPHLEEVRIDKLAGAADGGYLVEVKQEASGVAQEDQKIPHNIFQAMKITANKESVSIVTDPLAEGARHYLRKKLTDLHCEENFEFLEKLYGLNSEKKIAIEQLAELATKYVIDSANVASHLIKVIQAHLESKQLNITLFQKIAEEIFSNFFSNNPHVIGISAELIGLFQKAQGERVSLQKKALVLYFRLDFFSHLQRPIGDGRLYSAVPVELFEDTMSEISKIKRELYEILENSFNQANSDFEKIFNEFCRKQTILFQKLQSKLPEKGNGILLNRPNVELMIKYFTHPSPDDLFPLLPKELDGLKPLLEDPINLEPAINVIGRTYYSFPHLAITLS